jgi:hypothetical protein
METIQNICISSYPELREVLFTLQGMLEVQAKGMNETPPYLELVSRLTGAVFSTITLTTVTAENGQQLDNGIFVTTVSLLSKYKYIRTPELF